MSVWREAGGERKGGQAADTAPPLVSMPHSNESARIVPQTVLHGELFER